MSESGPARTDPPKAGRNTADAQSSLVGGGWGDPRISASKFADANEGSRNVRRPWVWALGWVGGFVAVIAALILILR
ncbi:MAG TPA: hypothetical protein VFZ86_15405 [Thermoleophilia bacterium]|nr:hypothetical protein [Thermoleophilia bacterium]